MQRSKPLVVIALALALIVLATGVVVLARQAGQPLLRLDLAAAVDGDLPARQAVELALRDARLAGALPVIAGWDVALDASDGSAAGLLPAAKTEFVVVNSNNKAMTVLYMYPVTLFVFILTLLSQ